MKTYEYIYNGAMQFSVIKRWVDKDNKQHEKEYLLSYKKKKWHCSCDGFKYSKIDKKTCRHIKDIMAQIKQKDSFILKNKSDFDWGNNWLFSNVKRRGRII